MNSNYLILKKNNVHIEHQILIFISYMYVCMYMFVCEYIIQRLQYSSGLSIQPRFISKDGINKPLISCWNICLQFAPIS